MTYGTHTHAHIPAVIMNQHFISCRIKFNHSGNQPFSNSVTGIKILSHSPLSVEDNVFDYHWNYIGYVIVQNRQCECVISVQLFGAAIFGKILQFCDITVFHFSTGPTVITRPRVAAAEVSACTARPVSIAWIGGGVCHRMMCDV